MTDMIRKENNRKNIRSTRMDSVFLVLKHDKAAVISLLLLGVIILFALIAPFLPVDPNATDVANRLKEPSLQHWFGTDEVGRDYFARVIYGGRVSLLVGFLAMLTRSYHRRGRRHHLRPLRRCGGHDTYEDRRYPPLHTLDDISDGSQHLFKTRP